ncbi:MAG TPA: TIGR00725 family protein [candidate division WOR-3 bacterium]|uniref:TIGR00725 family protein n=1 Tax=candidate division WOR-3 bacterium TaxID=2052148 RepID=A0A9C9K1C2_UNCW3|nr:TIGR00725 family protein [candidate division WOR-3 bacterium]
MIKKTVAVIGGSEPDQKSLVIAEEMGRLIARHHAVLVTGGLGGVMNAASKGAKELNGFVIGILPGNDKEDANPYVDIPIVTGLGEARNIIIARTCDCAVAINGKYGTLSEIAYCLMFNKPIIGINTWSIEAPIIKVKSAEEAADVIFNKILI